jgi:hypothetical protein
MVTMNWSALLLIGLSLPTLAQAQSKNSFIEQFSAATKENVPGQDKIMHSFSFTDASDTKNAVILTPKKIMPIKNLAKMSPELQNRYKINPNDDKEYYFINFLEEAGLKNSKGEQFQGMVSVSRMVRKVPKTGEVEFLHPSGDWQKVLSSSSKIVNENGAFSQSAIDAQLTPLADAGVSPVGLAPLLKDPELVCKWVGVPKAIKVSTGKYDKKYFCRSQVECSSQFLLGGYELEGGSYDVSCVNETSDCSAYLRCMQYVEDDDFEILKKSIPANSVHQ